MTDVDCFRSPSVSTLRRTLRKRRHRRRVCADRALATARRRGGRRRTTLLREVPNALLDLLRTGCPSGGCCRASSHRGARSTVTFGGSGRKESGRRSRPPCSWRLASRLATRHRQRRGSSTAKASRPPKLAARVGSMPARRSTAASAICSPTRWACRCGWSSMPPTSRTATAWGWSARHPTAFPLAAAAVRRCWVSGRDRLVYRGRRAAAARDRQAPARRRGLSPAAPARWVIERTFARLGRNRRLPKDFERLIETSTAMAAIASIQLLMRRLAIL